LKRRNGLDMSKRRSNIDTGMSKTESRRRLTSLREDVDALQRRSSIDSIGLKIELKRVTNREDVDVPKRQSSTDNVMSKSESKRKARNRREDDVLKRQNNRLRNGRVM